VTDDDEMSRDALVTSLTAENEQLFHDNIDYQEEVATLRRLLGRLRFLVGPVDDDALIGFMERAIDKANVLEAERDRLRAVVIEYQRADADAKDALEDDVDVDESVRRVARFLAARDALLAFDVDGPVEIRSLTNENERMRAVVDAAQRERDAYNALPLIPSGEPHEAWVAALLELHDAVLELFDGTETT
jgi:hypothetical protein